MTLSKGSVALRVIVPLLVGCGAPYRVSMPTTAMKTYPLEVEYELMPRVGDKFCASDDELRAYAAHPDRQIGSAWLAEMARYVAVPEDADGLVEVRGFTKYEHGQLCVYVSGRPYRLKSMRAVGHGLAQAPPPAPARGLFKLPTRDEDE